MDRYILYRLECLGRPGGFLRREVLRVGQRGCVPSLSSTTPLCTMSSSSSAAVVCMQDERSVCLAYINAVYGQMCRMCRMLSQAVSQILSFYDEEPIRNLRRQKRNKYIYRVYYVRPAVAASVFCGAAYIFGGFMYVSFRPIR